MKTRLFPALIALACTLPALSVEKAPDAKEEILPIGRQKEMKVDELPDWLIEFSNMAREDRQAYLESFNRAKALYQTGDWNKCLLEINNCESIYNKNPNLWNLRLSCMIEAKSVESAEEILAKVKEALPQDNVTLLNIANLHMIKKEYRECVTELIGIISSLPYDASPEMVNILRYRILLSHLMLGEEEEAKDIIQDLTPLSDTPLYYYALAAFDIYHGKRQDALMNINAANSIFSKGQATVPYQRGITASGIIDKYLPAIVPQEKLQQAGEAENARTTAK